MEKFVKQLWEAKDKQGIKGFVLYGSFRCRTRNHFSSSSWILLISRLSNDIKMALGDILLTDYFSGAISMNFKWSNYCSLEHCPMLSSIGLVSCIVYHRVWYIKIWTIWIYFQTPPLLTQLLFWPFRDYSESVTTKTKVIEIHTLFIWMFLCEIWVKWLNIYRRSVILISTKELMNALIPTCDLFWCS